MILQEHSTFTQRVYPAGAPLPADADLYVGQMGRMESRGGFQWEQLADGASLHAVLEGKGRVWCDGVAHDACVGDLFVFRKGHTYRYADTPADPWKYTYFTLFGGRAEACMKILNFTDERPVRAVPFSSPFWVKLQNLTAEFEQGGMAGVSPVRAAWELIESLSYQTDRQSVPKRAALAETARKLIESTPNLRLAKWRASRALTIRSISAAPSASATASPPPNGGNKSHFAFCARVAENVGF